MLRPFLLLAGVRGVINASARDAWQELATSLRPFIGRRVRSSADVDDLVQEVFLRMQRSLGGLRDEERYGAWVYTIARSAIADHYRAAARHPPGGASVAADPDVSITEEEGAAERELAAHVAVFIAMLPSPYREALTLTEMEGLTQKDAAAMLGISLSGMKSRVQRARQQLREAVEASCRIALDARGRVVSCEPRSDGRLPACRCR